MTPETWDDFEALFGERGACGGCWCMLWRLRAKEFEAEKGQGTRARMKALVKASAIPGIIIYQGKHPVGWCSVGPRADFIRLETSRVLAPVDERPVWSLTCLVVDKEHRRQGLSSYLVQSALEFAKAQGATCLEAYPIIPKGGKVPDVFAWNGFYSTFAALGFQVAAKRSDSHPVVRLDL